MEHKAFRVNSYLEGDKDTYYYKGEDNNWYLWIPGVGLGNLKAHQVTENADGTISVTPSILVSSPMLVDGHDVTASAHGYLTNGIWKDC